MMRWFLSKWTQQQVPGVGVVNMPALFAAYPGTPITTDDGSYYSASARYAVCVASSPAALLMDWRFPAVRDGDDPKSFVGYQNAMADALANWLAAQTVTVDGITLAADMDSQHRFTSLMVLAQSALAANKATAKTQMWVIDTSSVQRALAVPDLVNTLVDYGLAVQTLMGQYYAWKAQILAAQTKIALDAVSYS